MKRLFLWLWLLTSACFLASVFLLNHLLDGIYTPVQDRVFAQQVRGQVYALRTGLEGLDAAQQRERLRRWQPHYGIRLSLLDTPPALDAREQATLRTQGFIVRDQYQQILLPIDGATGRWLHLRLPGEVRMKTHMTIAAYLSILLLVGACLYAWVRLLWRDLEALRRHADRIGSGDLQARAGFATLADPGHRRPLQPHGRTRGRTGAATTRTHPCHFARTAHAHRTHGLRPGPDAGQR
jgi:two-component system sensor kinase ParS